MRCCADMWRLVSHGKAGLARIQARCAGVSGRARDQDTLLVRVRSTVQSCPAAPPDPLSQYPDRARPAQSGTRRTHYGAAEAAESGASLAGRLGDVLKPDIQLTGRPARPKISPRMTPRPHEMTSRGRVPHPGFAPDWGRRRSNRPGTSQAPGPRETSGALESDRRRRRTEGVTGRGRGVRRESLRFRDRGGAGGARPESRWWCLSRDRSCRARQKLP
jgi:hypothetical protein